MIVLLSILLFWVAGYGYALSILILDEIEMQEYITKEDIKIMKIFAMFSWFLIFMHLYERWMDYKEKKKNYI